MVNSFTVIYPQKHCRSFENSCISEWDSYDSQVAVPEFVALASHPWIDSTQTTGNKSERPK